MHANLEQALRTRIFWITPRIAIGQFPSEGRCRELLAQGVTHVINVGEAESLPATRSVGFRSVIDFPIPDLEQISLGDAIRAVVAIHRALEQPDSKLYIHCIACENRSPTILWLYLQACGMEDLAARRMITSRCPDAVPGHEALVNEELVTTALHYGKSAMAPLNDPMALVPAY